MRERIESLGGRIAVRSWLARPGRSRHGTRIEAQLPLPS
jgi:hypothetical protein